MKVYLRDKKTSKQFLVKGQGFEILRYLQNNGSNINYNDSIKSIKGVVDSLEFSDGDAIVSLRDVVFSKKGKT